MSLNKKIINSSLWSLLSASSYQFFGLFVFILLSRILTPLDFGLASLAIVFVELSYVIVRFGLVQVLIRASDEDLHKASNNVFCTSLLIGIFISFLFVFFASYLEELFDVKGLAAALHLLAIVPTLQALEVVPEGLLKRDFKFKTIAIRLIMSSVFGGGIAIILALNGMGFYALIVQRIVSTLLGLMLVWRYITWRPSFSFTDLNLLETVKKGLPIMLSTLIGQSIFRFVELTVSFFLGVTALGYLKIAGKLLDVIVQFTIKPIVDVSFSAFSNLKSSSEQLENCYLNFITTCALFALPAFFGTYILGTEMVRLIFGEQWSISGQLLSVLCLGGMSSTLNYFFTQLCNATENSHIPFRIRMIEFVVVLSLVAISAQYSITYVVYSTVLVATLISVMMLIILKKKFLFSISKIFKGILPSFLSALFMGGAVYISLQTQLQGFDEIIKVICSVFIGGISYVLFYKIIFPKNVTVIIANIKKLRG